MVQATKSAPEKRKHFRAALESGKLLRFPGAFSPLCAGGTCVKQPTGGNQLDSLADRLMFRLAYRNFGDHESLVGNWTVNSNNVAGVRWFELRGVSAGPVTTFQESTYQPDTTWRWMGSIAMDKFGNMGLGFSASDATIHPQVRYTGRMSTDPINTMSLGEGHIFDGAGSQTATSNRWGDYSDMTVDPVDDQTFWYTQEYYDTVTSFNWRTRIGNFKLGGAVTPDFTLSISPPSIKVPKAGGSAVYTVTITPTGGFNSAVTLSVSGLPAGTTGAFNPNPATTSSTLTLTVNSSTAAGTYVFTVTGVGGSPPMTHTATATLIKKRR
jgi:hypothetical protein